MANKDTVKYDVIDASGKVVSSLELVARVFDAECSVANLNMVRKQQLSKKRAGTHATINLAKMDNNKKKPYRQKGTGRSRCGSRYSPIRVGGAVAHGPQPRNYEFDVNKKVKSSALASALTDKQRSGALRVVDSIEDLKSGKTKDAAKFFKGIDANQKQLLVVQDLISAEQVIKACRNLSGCKVLSVEGLNVYDMLNAKTIVLAQDTVSALVEKRFAE